MNILFLTASTGGGHVKAALALMEHMRAAIPDLKVKLVDALKYVSPAADRLIAGTYLQTIKKAPYIYGKLYSLSEKDERITAIVKSISKMLAPGLMGIFTNDPPDAVVCTHTIPLQMVSALKKQGVIDTPVIGIVTDYASHYFWKLDETDALIVPHERIKSNMTAIGIDKNRIYAYGIPVSGRFTGKFSPNGIRRSIRESKPRVLLMGGSLGLCGMDKAFGALLRFDRDIHITAVTGYNEGLRKRLERMVSGSGRDVDIFGYTDNICDLMESSALIITKPGGVTVAEALIKKLPVLILDPIPGQEERNAGFLAESGAGLRLMQPEDLCSTLESILDSPVLLRKMSEAAGALAKPNACEDITRLVMRLTSKELIFS